jgi:2-oxoglutarate dehydrogenase E1 component
VSTPQELTDGGVEEVIPAETDPADTTRHILCSGKVYYDLVKTLEDDDRRDEIAITRLEQFYPFPEADIRAELERYADADETVWVQEEPRNMGAWTFVESRLDTLLDDVHGHCEQRIQYVGRPASASPATGSAKVHDREQELLVHDAIDV